MGQEAPVAVVTGASRGIGAAIAVGVAEDGYDIVAVSRGGEAPEVAEQVRAAGRQFIGLACDLADRAAVRALPATIVAAVGVPDVLVHAAGVNRRAFAADYPDELWDEVLAVNLTAPFLLTRELGRQMLERGSGSVVLVASLASFQGGWSIAGYAAAKGGIAQLTKAFANEWAADGVRVNAVAPGYTMTDMNRSILEDPTRREQIDVRIPAGRWASAEEIAAPVRFLISPAASYVHGTVVAVDGGWLGR